MRHPTRPTASLLLAACALALAGCGADTAPAGSSLASAIMIDAGVDVAIDDAEFVAVGAPADVAAGDLVRTDTTGFAEIVYFDGSVSRLDVSTTLEVVELRDAPEDAAVRTGMDIGRTWHRVVDGVTGRTYEVETRVATAAVRGTTFLVDCSTPLECTFTVFDGSVEVTPIGGEPFMVTAPDSVTVMEDGAALPTDRNPDDPWAQRNISLDAGVPDGAAAAPDDAGPTPIEQLSGTYELSISDPTVSDDTCVVSNVRRDGEFVSYDTDDCGDVLSTSIPLVLGTLTFDCQPSSTCIGEDSTSFLAIDQAEDGTLAVAGSLTCGDQGEASAPPTLVVTARSPDDQVQSWSMDYVEYHSGGSLNSCATIRYTITAIRVDDGATIGGAAGSSSGEDDTSLCASVESYLAGDIGVWGYDFVADGAWDVQDALREATLAATSSFDRPGAEAVREACLSRGIGFSMGGE